MAIGCNFVLPLEGDSDEIVKSEFTTLLTVDADGKEFVKEKSAQGQTPLKTAAKKSSKFNQLKFTWRMIRWHIFIFLAIFSSIYATFHYGFDKEQKKIILKAVAFCDDWKHLAFFFGIYLSFTVKKVSDVSSVSF